MKNFILSEICRIHFPIRSNTGIMAGNRDLGDQSESSEVENLINLSNLMLLLTLLDTLDGVPCITAQGLKKYLVVLH